MLDDRVGEVTTIAGAGKTTLDELAIDHERTQGDLDLNRWRDGHPNPDPPQASSPLGDGTVLADSVHNTGADNDNQIVKSGVDHADLPAESQNDVVDILLGESHASYVPAHLASSAVSVDIYSPILPTITGPNGEVLSSTENTFNDAIFEWDDSDPLGEKFLTIIDPPPGTYTVTLEGLADGEYTTVFTFGSDAIVTQQEDTGEASPTFTKTYTFTIGEDADSFTLEDPNPSSDDDGTNSGGSDGPGDVGGPSDDHGPDPVTPTSKKKGSVLGVSTASPACELIPQVDTLFTQVFGRNPNSAESAYWQYRVRRGDKQTAISLIGAMQWFQKNNKTNDAKLLLNNPAILKQCPDATLLESVDTLFTQVFSTTPTPAEHAFWYARVASGDKQTEQALLGAMYWHKARGRTM